MSQNQTLNLGGQMMKEIISLISNTVLSFLIVIVVVNTIYSKCTQNLILVTLVIIYPTLTKFMQMSMLIVGNSLW